MSIIVFGSINMDLVVRTPKLPAPGETLTGYSFVTVPGGKGANQAVACARLGAETHMVGRVGGDAFGEVLVTHLSDLGIQTGGVKTDPGCESGVAIIAVDDQAENNIIIVPGANHRVGQDDLAALEPLLDQAKVLLLQLEVPLEATMQAARMAKAKGVTVVLDPAPAQALPAEIYPLVDILTPNETETASMVGFDIDGVGFGQRAAEILLERGVGRAIIKMGGLGAYTASADDSGFYDALPVDAVDTVAAGDAFNGGLAAALSEGASVDQAMRWAITAGALAVTKSGAQDAMPSREELETALI
jgi:ribokinase